MRKLTRRHFAALFGALFAGTASVAAADEGLKEEIVRVLVARHSGASGSEAAHGAAPSTGGHGTSTGGHSAALPKNMVTPAGETLWADLMVGNRRFIGGAPQERTLVPTRVELAKGQAPKVVVLGCADSRLSPTLIFDKSLGDLFVVRAAGNIADAINLGSIEYSLEHLGSAVVVVLGHEKCGAVAAAAEAYVSKAKMPTANLQAIVNKITPAFKRVSGYSNAAELSKLGIEANVHQSAEDILRDSPIIHELVAEGKASLIKAVYRLETGEVVRLA